MDAQIVFLTLFLGIVSGQQPVALQVSAPVKSVRVLLGGQEVAVLTEPPWRAIVDFGPELAPRELTAVAFDAKGGEVARAAQILNLPRPTAEFEILLAADDVSLHWRHLMQLRPSVATITLDGRALALDGTLHTRLPKLDREQPHLLAAEMRFSDGFVARREVVIESVRSTSVGTQLTPIVVRETAPDHPSTWDGCLTTPAGAAVRTAAVEKPPALVIMVRSPDPRDVQQTLDRSRVMIMNRSTIPLDQGTIERILWPVAQRYSNGGDTSVLFERTGDFSGSIAGILYLMRLKYAGKNEGIKGEFADAVAVAGIQAITGAQRRAVVFVLSATADSSRYDPAVVRRYLQSLGVPLFVWSLTGPRPELADTWGPVEDIGTLPKLEEATKRVRKALDEQRVAWVDVDPLTALQLNAKESCGIATMTRAAR
jgi:hypothetical protein